MKDFFISKQLSDFLYICLFVKLILSQRLIPTQFFLRSHSHSHAFLKKKKESQQQKRDQHKVLLEQNKKLKSI